MIQKKRGANAEDINCERSKERSRTLFIINERKPLQSGQEHHHLTVKHTQ